MNADTYSQQDNTDSSILTASWSTPGTYSVTIDTDCADPAKLTRTVTVVDTTPGAITPNGTASNVSATEATICFGSSLELRPPASSANWDWSGASLTANSSGVATVRPTAEENYYTLTYSPTGTQCRITSTFLVKVPAPLPAVELVRPDATGPFWRLGAGTFTLEVANHNPAYQYNWYEGTSAVATGFNKTYTTSSFSGTDEYYQVYLTATACQESKTSALLLLRRLELRVAGSVPPGPVRLAPGVPLTLAVAWAIGQSPQAIAWFRNGTLISNQTGPSLTVTEPGSYLARIDYPTTFHAYNSTQTVEVLGGLEGQAVNGQALTYVRNTQVLQAGVATAEAVTQLPAAERTQRLTYLTGWAQPLQQLSVQAGPNQEDILQHYSYAGESPTAAQAYLPAAVATTEPPRTPGLYVADPVAKVTAYYASLDSQPYGQSTLEASPLSRPLTQAQPGSAWASHAASARYETNATPDNVHRWVGLDGTATYAAGQLTKQVLLDADNRRTELYQDALGRTVLQRKVTGYGSASPKTFDTYSVYAPAGYLQYVIPPAAVEALTTANTWQVNTMPVGFADKWLYQYTYDDKGRLVERKFPGAAVVYLVYDPFDRLILVQDGTHRAAQQWLFTKYDAQNRAVVSGLYSYPGGGSATPRQDLQQLADNSSLTAGYERRTAGGYSTNQTFPALGGNDVVLSVNLFDDYDLDQDASHVPDVAYAPQAVTPQPVATAQVRGLPTISRRRVVQPGGQYGAWLTTAFFYDEYGNVVQQQGDNLLQQGGAGLGDVTTLVYRGQGFVPQVLSSLKVQRTDAPGSFSPVVQVRQRFAYDAAGRLLRSWQQQQWKGEWEPEVLVSSHTYTGLGELTTKRLHSRDGVAFLQKVDLAYNLHGQLTRINQSSVGALANPENDLFGLQLYREQAGTMGNVPRYDGGISAVTWMAHNAAQPNQPERERSYRFAYDGLGRLTAARYAARLPGTGVVEAGGGSLEGGTNPWVKEVGAYDEKDIAYDANGNLTALKRYSQANATAAPVLLDNLTFTYATPTGTSTGNQHDRISDAADAGRGFRDAAGSGTEYSYDANGSITTDANKGVGYVYNALNKVEKQTVGTQALVYTYDAAGTLLRRDTQAGGAVTQSEYYVDGLVYQFKTGYSGLASVPTAEGRALVSTPAADRLTYEYHLRDHLGNLRVAFRAQAGTEDLRLSSEDASEEGEYPKFKNVISTRSTSVSVGAYHGSYAATVTKNSERPSITIPVAHLDHLKLRVYYKTPAGRQYPAGGPVDGRPAASPLQWSVAPVLLPTAPGPQGEQRGRAVPGLQLGLTGLLSRLTTPQAARQTPADSPASVGAGGELQAYLRWTLLDANGIVLNTGTRLAPATTDSRTTWTKLDLPYDVDLSNADTRTGTLLLEEVNEGSQAVYFDSLTITHPKERALVSQENHYYPFGMALSGVAVNTVPVPDLSKEQFNQGSALQDELLGTEGGVYSTPFRTYDPTTGRFTGVDPLADATFEWTPYQFALANPISVNDPTGALASWSGWDAFLRDALAGNVPEGTYTNSGGGGGGGVSDFISQAVDFSGLQINARDGVLGYYKSFGGVGDFLPKIGDGIQLQSAIVGMKFTPLYISSPTLNSALEWAKDHKTQIFQTIGALSNGYTGVVEAARGVALVATPEPTFLSKPAGVYMAFDGSIRALSVLPRLAGILYNDKNLTNTPGNLLGVVGYVTNSVVTGNTDTGSRTQILMEFAGNLTYANYSLGRKDASPTELISRYYTSYDTARKLK